MVAHHNCATDRQITLDRPFNLSGIVLVLEALLRRGTKDPKNCGDHKDKPLRPKKQAAETKESKSCRDTRKTQELQTHLSASYHAMKPPDNLQQSN